MIQLICIFIAFSGNTLYDRNRDGISSVSEQHVRYYSEKCNPCETSENNQDKDDEE